MYQQENQKSVIKLNNCVECCIYPRLPFHFDATVHKPSHFPSSDNYYKKGEFCFTTYFLNQPIGIKMLKSGSIENPRVNISIYTENVLDKSNIDEIISEIVWRFDMDANLNDFFNSFNNDTLLQPVFEKWKGMRVGACQSLYEFIVITFVLQNATVRRSVQMMENLFNAYGYKLQFDNQVLSCFWPPELLAYITEEELRTLKVGYRAKFLLKLSQAFEQKTIDEKKMRLYSKELLRNELLKIYGIGPASVWYLMFEVFHHYDALETISPWEQKIYSKLLFNQKLVEKNVIMQEVTIRWGKWRMLAMHYIFEDLFGRRKENKIDWLEELIRL